MYCRMYVKVLFNIMNNYNNKKGGVVAGGRFDPKPSQIGEKGKKEEEK